MNEPPSLQPWSPMDSSAPDDFTTFLDFGDFTSFGFQDAPTGEHSAPAEFGEDMPMAIDPALENTSDTMPFDRRGDLPPFEQQAYPSEMQMRGHGHTGTSEDALFHQTTTHATNLPQQQWRAPNMIPPTPNSMDLTANHMHQYSHEINQQRQRELYEQYRSMQKDQMNFTPLVSPAVTPLETQLRYSDHPVETFSPLTSPALVAANMSMLTGGRGLRMSNTTSPVDYSLEFASATSIPPPSSVRKSRRKMSTNSIRTPARSVKASPAMKPQQKKKQISSTTISANEVRNTLDQVKRGTEQITATVGLERTTTAPDSSATDSVSPESLSDILMPPPATPQSVSNERSPVINGKSAESEPPIEQVEQPATPASLMRIKKQATKTNARKREASHLKEQTAHEEADMEQVMHEIALPEPAASRNRKLVPQSLDTARANTKGQSSKLTDKTEDKAPIASTPSVLASPTSKALTSPSGPSARKELETMPKPKETKKRGSSSGEKISPALRPRISPSIKPLLPEGVTVSPETSALLLASKSNYQNILEGTHFPGVSYPENLSTNLTSKRTSHKIAEQGRRNRINTALQEIAALLPPTPPVGPMGSGPTMPTPNTLRAEEVSMSAGTAQQQANSKASTVEAAIDYIKSLQREVKDCRETIAKYEQTPEIAAKKGADENAVESEGNGES